MVDGNQNTDAGNYQSNIVVGKSSRRKLPKSEGFTKKLKHFNKIWLQFFFFTFFYDKWYLQV